jgi:RNA polymerase sigma-70 factor, ECF subfamily
LESIAQLSDQELVDRARQGEQEAFSEIVRRHSPRIFQTASRFFRQRSQVEDIAQEVFLKAYTQLSSYEGRGSFEGWLTRIATNTCLNHLRSSKRKHESTLADVTEDQSLWLERHAGNADHQPSFEDELVAADLADKLLEQIPPEDRMVLTLVDADELSTREVAALTGWSESKVKVRAFRARGKMRQALAKLMKGKKQ